MVSPTFGLMCGLCAFEIKKKTTLSTIQLFDPQLEGVNSYRLDRFVPDASCELEWLNA